MLNAALVVENAGMYTVFSPALGQWIKNEMLNPGTEKEDETSVEKWVEDNGKNKDKQTSTTLLKFKKRYWPIIV